MLVQGRRLQVSVHLQQIGVDSRRNQAIIQRSIGLLGCGSRLAGFLQTGEFRRSARIERRNGDAILQGMRGQDAKVLRFGKHDRVERRYIAKAIQHMLVQRLYSGFFLDCTDQPGGFRLAQCARGQASAAQPKPPETIQKTSHGALPG